jgi:hypothetical protein
MISKWLLRGWHLLMLLPLFAIFRTIGDKSAATHGFQSRQMTNGETIGFMIALLILMVFWLLGAKIIKSFR